jgi:hypothetical protein
MVLTLEHDEESSQWNVDIVLGHGEELRVAFLGSNNKTRVFVSNGFSALSVSKAIMSPC